MPTYTASFHTTVGSAFITLKATSPDRALDKAQALYRDRPERLHFEPYESEVEEIAIHDATDVEVASW